MLLGVCVSKVGVNSVKCLKAINLVQSSWSHFLDLKQTDRQTDRQTVKHNNTNRQVSDLCSVSLLVSVSLGICVHYVNCTVSDPHSLTHRRIGPLVNIFFFFHRQSMTNQKPGNW